MPRFYLKEDFAEGSILRAVCTPYPDRATVVVTINDDYADDPSTLSIKIDEYCPDTLHLVKEDGRYLRSIPLGHSHRSSYITNPISVLRYAHRNAEEREGILSLRLLHTREAEIRATTSAEIRARLISEIPATPANTEEQINRIVREPYHEHNAKVMKILSKALEYNNDIDSIADNVTIIYFTGAIASLGVLAAGGAALLFLLVPGFNVLILGIAGVVGATAAIGAGVASGIYMLKPKKGNRIPKTQFSGQLISY